MSGDEKAYKPPTTESLYWSVHPDNIPAGTLADMQEQIAASGVYVGPVTQYSALTGAVEVVMPSEPGGLIKIMPDAIRLPYDHPARGFGSSIGQVAKTTLNETGAPVAESRPHQHADGSDIMNEYARGAVADLGTTAEALAGFLQIFTDAADESHVGQTDADSGYELIQYRGIDFQHVKYIPSTGPTYALLRGDRAGHRRPYAADEYYTIVNMETGDELTFAHSDVERIRGDEYVRNDRHGSSIILVGEIAAVAGIANQHNEGDPIISLTRDEASSATLKTDEQIERLERLLSLGSAPCERARITFEPETAEELLKFLSRSGAEWIAPQIDAITAPNDTAPLVVDDGVFRFAFSNLMSAVRHYDTPTQTAIYRCISAIDFSECDDAWLRANNVETLVRASVTLGEEGAYTENPGSVLIDRLNCDQYDLLEAVYKAADGLYLETQVQALGETKAKRQVRERLNESKARCYATALERALIDTVVEARDALHVSEELTPVEQITEVLKQHGFIQKGMRLIQNNLIQQRRPSITVPQWAEICMIADRCRNNRITCPLTIFCTLRPAANISG